MGPGAKDFWQQADSRDSLKRSFAPCMNTVRRWRASSPRYESLLVFVQDEGVKSHSDKITNGGRIAGAALHFRSALSR